jgi:hypothetical protein
MNLDSYEDPEGNDWILPDIPNPASVPDNTSCFGPLYFWRGVANPAQARISVAVTREITPPWRRGLGITVRGSHAKGSKSYAVGLWWPGKPPQILTGAPTEQNWGDVVRRSSELKEKKKS